MPYWSGYDTLVLVTGILTALIAAIPVGGIPVKTRLISAVIGVGLIIISLITGSLQAFTYPSVVSVGPAIPVIAGLVIGISAYRSKPSSGAATPAATVPAASGVPAAAAAIPATPPPAAPPARVPASDVEREAANAATAPARLAQLAADHPETRVWIASNPSTYPDLRTWLAGLGDPDVDAALAAPAAVRRVRPSPFSGMSRGEIAHDIAAAALLLLAFFLPVQGYGPAWVKVIEVLALLPVLAALLAGYLNRAAIVSVRASTAVRLLLVVPFALLSLAILLADALSSFQFADTGVGASIAFGLAASALVVASRPIEGDDDGIAVAYGRLAYPVVMVVIALMGVFWLLRMVTSGVGVPGLLSALGALGVVGAPLAWFLVRREQPARLLLTILGVMALGWCLFGAPGLAESTGSDGVLVSLLPAAAATALAAPRVTTGTVSLSRLLFALIGLVAAVRAVVAGSAFFFGALEVGPGVAIVLASLLIAAIAFTLASSALPALAGTARGFIGGGLLLVLGIAYLVIHGVTGYTVGFFEVAMAVLAPVALICEQLIVMVVTTQRQAVVLAGDVAAVIEAAPEVASGPEPVPEPHRSAQAAVAAHGFTAAQAADPATDAATLYRISLEAPELRPQLAANPSTYGDLLDWLADLGEPEVDAALAIRTHR